MVVKAVLAVLALVALGMGGVFSWIGVSSQREAGRLPGLPRLARADFTAGNLGMAGFVEGELAADNPTWYQDLVLYFRSELTGFSTQLSQGVTGGGGKRPVWRPLSKKLPPVGVEVDGERILVFGAYGVTFKGSDRGLLTTDSLVPGETERYEGLHAGQLVTAVGTVGFAAEVPGLDTESLISGSHQDAVEGARRAARFGLIAGGAMLIVGLVLAVLATTV